MLLYEKISYLLINVRNNLTTRHVLFLFLFNLCSSHPLLFSCLRSVHFIPSLFLFKLSSSLPSLFFFKVYSFYAVFFLFKNLFLFLVFVFVHGLTTRHVLFLSYSSSVHLIPCCFLVQGMFILFRFCSCSSPLPLFLLCSSIPSIPFILSFSYSKVFSSFTSLFSSRYVPVIILHLFLHNHCSSFRSLFLLKLYSSFSFSSFQVSFP